jgi:DNA-binding HxlR family transcriptional regulator
MKRRRKIRRSACPISVALDVFGDAWTLLIIRDLMLKGIDTFNAFLASDEHIATNILSDRLARLEAEGIIEKRRDSDDARRFHYSLTEKGIDLAPMLVEITLWSARHEKTAAPPAVVKEMSRDPRSFAMKAAERARRSRETN